MTTDKDNQKTPREDIVDLLHKFLLEMKPDAAAFNKQLLADVLSSAYNLGAADKHTSKSKPILAPNDKSDILMNRLKFEGRILGVFLFIVCGILSFCVVRILVFVISCT